MGIIIRQSIKGTIVTYIGVFIGLITNMFILPTYLSEEEIGLSRVLVDTAMMFVGFAQLGTNSSIIKFFPYFKNKEQHDHGFFFWTLIIPFFGFLFFGFLYFFLKVPVSELFIEKSPLFVDYYYFVIPLAFFMLYQAIFDSNANVLMRVVTPKFVREVLVRLLSLAAYLLYAFQIINLDGFVVVFCIVYAVATITNIFYVFSIQKISLKPDFKFLTKPLLKNYLFYTFFLLAAALGSVVTPYVNTFFISAQMGLATMGVFAIASYIATLVDIPYRSLGAISQPHISQYIKDGDIVSTNRICKKVSLHQWLVGSFILFFIWINIDLFFEIMPNGNKFVLGKWIVLILGISKLLNSTMSVTGSVLNYSVYYYYSLVSMFLLTVLAIVFNNMLIPLYGMNGAAIASLLAYVVYFLFLVVLVLWKLKVFVLSCAQLKVTLIVAVLYVLNQLWTNYITPVFFTISCISEFYISILEALFRSAVWLALAFFAIYKWKVSEELNITVDKYLKNLSSQ